MRFRFPLSKSADRPVIGGDVAFARGLGDAGKFLAFFLTLGGLAGCREEDKGAAHAPPPAVRAESMDFEVLERSEHPGHKTSEYPDCLFMARLRVIDPGRSGDGRVVLAAIPAFLGRRLQPGAALRAGDRIRGDWVPMADAPPGFRRMQLADRFGDFHLETFLVTGIRILGTGSKDAFPPVAGPVPTAGPIPPSRFIRSPGSPARNRERDGRVAAEIGRIDRLLRDNGGTWDAWMRRLKPVHDLLDSVSRTARFALRKDRLFFNRLAFHHYHELCEDDPHTGPVGALRLLNAELDRLGIDLLVVPFPTKEDINAHRFVEGGDPADEINPRRLRFHRHLLDHNIEVLDLAPALRAALDEHEYVFFDNSNVHPADGGIQVAGREIARVLRDYGLGLPEGRLLPVSTSSMLVNEDVPGFVMGTRYPATQVDFPATFSVPAEDQRRVLFQGDSFLQVPSRFVPHASIVDHVGRHLGFPPETVLREGGANLILQDLSRTPRERFLGRQVFVFVFGPTRLRSPRSGLARPDYQWHLALLPG